MASCSSDQPTAPAAGADWSGIGGVVPPEEAAALRARWAVEDAARLMPLPPPFPSQPGIVIDHFRHAYKTMDLKTHANMLRADYVCLLDPSTAALFPEVGTELDWTESATIHRNMFAGEPGSGPNGEWLPPVRQIRLQVLEPLTAWNPAPAEGPFPDTEYATYSVLAYFDRGEGYTVLRVQGLMRFYVASRDSLHEGTVQPYYQLVGQVDLTGGVKTEGNYWGTVLALFR